MSTINHKNFETNSSFHMKERKAGRVEFLSFRIFLLLLAGFPFGRGDWALGYHSMDFGELPDAS